MKRQTLILALLLFSNIGIAQTRGLDCSRIKTGKFYFYPSISENSFEILRDERVQAEIDLNTNDTTFFQIKWLSDCEYKLRFLRSTKKIEGKLLELFQTAIIEVEIIEISPSGYTFIIGAKNISFGERKKDKMLFSKKEPISADPVRNL